MEREELPELIRRPLTVITIPLTFGVLLGSSLQRANSYVALASAVMLGTVLISLRRRIWALLAVPLAAYLWGSLLPPIQGSTSSQSLRIESDGTEWMLLEGWVTEAPQIGPNGQTWMLEL